MMVALAPTASAALFTAHSLTARARPFQVAREGTVRLAHSGYVADAGVDVWEG